MPDHTGLGQARRQCPGKVHSRVLCVNKTDIVIMYEPVQAPERRNQTGQTRPPPFAKEGVRQRNNLIRNGTCLKVSAESSLLMEYNDRLKPATVKVLDQQGCRNMAAANRISGEGIADSGLVQVMQLHCS